MIDEDFRTYLIDELGDFWGEPGKVCEGFSSQSAEVPRIWYQRRSSEQDLMLDGVSEIVTTEFDLEVISDSIGEAQDVAHDIKAALHGYKGDFGEHVALLTEWFDHDDDYIPQGLGDGDEGVHVSSLAVRIIHI